MCIRDSPYSASFFAFILVSVIEIKLFLMIHFLPHPSLLFSYNIYQPVSYRFDLIPLLEVNLKVPSRDPAYSESYGFLLGPDRYIVFQILLRISDTACRSVTAHLLR